MKQNLNFASNEWKQFKLSFVPVLVVWVISAAYIGGWIPASFTDFFTVVAATLDTHRPWFYASYEYRDHIVAIHYLTLFALVPSCVLGGLTPLSNKQKQATQKLAYWKYALLLSLLVPISLALLLWFGSGDYHTYEHPTIRRDISLRMLNSFFGIYFLEYAAIGIWFEIGHIFRALFFKLTKSS